MKATSIYMRAENIEGGSLTEKTSMESSEKENHQYIEKKRHPDSVTTDLRLRTAVDVTVPYPNPAHG